METNLEVKRQTAESRMLEQFRAARRVSTPLVAINTPDAAATIRTIATVTNGSALASWDIVRGMVGLNPAGQSAVAEALQGNDAAMTANPVESLTLAQGLPSGTVLFVHNAQRILTPQSADNAFSVIQATWNLRDAFKQNGRMLVMLGNPALRLPAELQSDVLVIEEALPDTDELSAIILQCHRDAGLSEPTAETHGKAIDALAGLSAYPAEQSCAMSLTRDGLNLSALWERKRQTIEQMRGLSVYRGTETFADIGGCDSSKTFLSRVLNGGKRPRAIVFIDEIEKSLAGAGGDTSGTSQEMLGTLLSYMQDTRASGVIFVGPPGAAKSAMAKAAGNTGKIPTILFDLSGMKASLVGESGDNLRNALKVVSAVSQGNTLFIATCNAIASLPPELRRRFKLGTFFFDLPTAEERSIIWNLYLKKFQLDASQQFPSDSGWTGAEIETCCDLADRLGISLLEAASYIVPVAQSAAESIERLRSQASGKFISASYPGKYVYTRESAAPQSTVKRAIQTEGN